jgi:hypothetical protein
MCYAQFISNGLWRNPAAAILRSKIAGFTAVRGAVSARVRGVVFCELNSRRPL